MERRPFGCQTLQQRQLVQALLPLPVLRGRMSLIVSSGMLTVVVLGTPGRLALPLTTSLEWAPVPELAVAQLLLLRVLVLAIRPHVNPKMILMAAHALGALLEIAHHLTRPPVARTLVNALRIMETAHPTQTVEEMARLVTATTQGVPTTLGPEPVLERRF